MLGKNLLGSKHLHRRNPRLAIGYGPDIENDDAIPLRIDECLNPGGKPHAILTPHGASKDTIY